MTARSRTGGGVPVFYGTPGVPIDTHTRHATRRFYGSRWGTRAASLRPTPAPSRLYERLLAEAVSADTVGTPETSDDLGRGHIVRLHRGDLDGAPGRGVGARRSPGARRGPRGSTCGPWTALPG